MMRVTAADFGRSLGELMHNRSPNLLTIRFDDVCPDGHVDVYTCRLQRMGGPMAGLIDCIPRLNNEPSWQVHRSQSEHLTVGRLLLLIASAPLSADPHEFFA